MALAVLTTLSVAPFTDALADTAGTTDQPSRIISAGGSITEILYALGLVERLIAVDTSSLYPSEVSTLPNIGYFRSLGAEGILSLNPDLIVAARGAGPPEVLEQISNLGVQVRLFEQSVYTLDSWKALITDIGEFFDRVAEAQTLIDEVQKTLNEISEAQDSPTNRLNAIALLSLGQRGPVVAGKNTVPDLLMTLAGINNLAAGLEGFKPFSTELLAKQSVDLILIPSHVADAMGGASAVCDDQAIAMATKQGCHVHIMDGLLLLGFGSRLHIAVQEVADQAKRIGS